MKVLFYGRLAEAICPALDLGPSTECTVGELRERLAAEYPEAAATLDNRRCRAVIGATLVREDQLVGSADRVEFLPPVSGG